MNHYHADDTRINRYLYRLREEMYTAIGIGASKWQVRFEDMFYDILNNGSVVDTYLLGNILNLATCEAFTDKPVHLQDVIAELKLRLPYYNHHK